jgi:hypothetical protein
MFIQPAIFNAKNVFLLLASEKQLKRLSAESTISISRHRRFLGGVGDAEAGNHLVCRARNMPARLAHGTWLFGGFFSIFYAPPRSSEWKQ